MRRFASLICCISLFAGRAHAVDAPIVPSLIPLPASMQTGDGVFTVDASRVLAPDGDDAMRVAERLNDFLSKAGRALLRIVGSHDERSSPPRVVFLGIAPSGDLPPEGYTLDIARSGIAIRAGDEAGLFYGAVTLWQLITQGEGEFVVLPELHIKDAPRFRWRGYMLDSARHFQTVEQVEKILDTMALHKLNVFHWHLTDDQGWRIEIKRYPKLTEVGGCRIPAGDAGVDPANGKPAPYCGWYTQDDVRRIVAYAAARHIAVVPEIDLPGHATAAIAAYPELGTEGKKIPVTAFRGIHTNLFNVEESTFRFLDDVFGEIAKLFPGEYVHVGGDEALKDQWKASPQVQAKIRALGLKDEAALQSWFIHRLEAILHRHGKRLVGWDEILEGGLAPDATVMSWRGTEGGIESAKQGHDVVMSPVSAMYLDYLQTDSPNEPAGRPKPKLLPLDRFYGFEPVPDALDATQRRHILGLQANMWTTDDVRFSAVEHNTFPRLLAVAETGWTPKEKKDYPGFLHRLAAWSRRYEALGVDYARTPFEVIADSAPGSRPDTVRVALHNPLGYPIRYTTDGSAPTSASTIYNRPLELPLPAQINATAFDGEKPLYPGMGLRARIAATDLLTRTDKRMQPCTAEGPVLRMQDDGPFSGERALFDVAIMQPCWLWENAPLQGIAGIEVRAGRLPYIINQSAKEDAARKYLPARSAYGELDVRMDSCDGETIAVAPLPAAPDADGFVTLRAALARRLDAPHALCIRFSGDFRPRMWVLDRATLSPAP